MNNFLVGSEWRNYLGLRYEDVKRELAPAMKAEKIDGRIVPAKRSLLLCSGEDALVAEVRSAVPYQIFIQKANCDPLTYFFLNFVTDKSRFDTLCFIAVRPLCSENCAEIARLFSRICAILGKKPWEVKEHPKMKNAWIMRRNIKRKWEKLFAALK